MTVPAWLERVIARATWGDASPGDRTTRDRVAKLWIRATGGRLALRRRLRWAEGARRPRQRLTEAVAGDPAVNWSEGLVALAGSLAATPATTAQDLAGALQPIVPAARREVEAQLSTRGVVSPVRLSEAAWQALGAALIARVSEPLQPAWDAWCAEHPLTRLAAGEPALAALRHELGAAGLRPLFERFPVAARLAGTVYTLELAAQVELLQRLAADLPTIEREWRLRLAPGEPAVRTLRLHLGDPHRAGRMVAAVEFSDATRIAYKPRPLAVEQALDELLAPVEPDRRRLRLLTRDGYGWCEWAEESAAAKPARLYERLGAIMAHAQVWGICDLHGGNIVLAGEHPLLIDPECLRPDVGFVGAQGAAEAASDPAARMLGSRLLPSWRRARASDGELHASGILRVGTTPNHVRAMQAGFRAMWSEWCERAKRWAHEPTTATPWSALADAPVRFLVRQTATYGLVTQRLLQPDALEDIRVFDVLTDMVANGGTESADRPAHWAACEAERRALFRLDVPAFSYRANTRDLHACDGTRIQNVFTEPPALRWRKRLEQLAGADGAREGGRAAALIERTLMPVAPPQPRTGRAGAGEIARYLVATAFPGHDGAPTWIGYEHDLAGQLIVPALAHEGLYQGRCGIALFLLAAGAECAAGAEVAACVFDTLAAAGPRETTDSGWAHGTAGRAIALEAAARLAPRTAWADAARRLAASLAENARAIVSASANASATWPQRDLFSGEAGIVLALANDGAHLDAARQLASRWEKWLATVSRRHGLAHGASGLAVATGRLAVALVRAGRLGDADDVWCSALRMLEPESRANADRSPAMHHATPALPGSWCDHHAGGALVRATLLRCAREIPSATERDLERLRAELRDERAHLAAAPDTALDLICCGNLGRIAGFLLASDDGGAEARRRVDRWIARAAQQGWTLDGTPREAWPAPGLFRGLAGAGLVLLAAEDRTARALLAAVVGLRPFIP